MTPRREIRNLATSLRHRLANLARVRRLDPSAVLHQYAAERFLYRLSVSDEVDHFTLKGAALFRVWDEAGLRPTRDIDFLASGPEEHARIRASLETICAVPCRADAVVYDPATIRMHAIRQDQPYGGVHVKIDGRLGKARLHLRCDMGFGDVVTPEREARNYPTLLDLPVPRVWTYPRETFIAEKFEALVSLGPHNSRLKDIWDIACLSHRFSFEGASLRNAVEATFRRRRTSLAADNMLPLRAAYYEEPTRRELWQALQRRIGPHAHGSGRLADAGEDLRRFLGPVCHSLTVGIPFTHNWPASGPWRPVLGS